MHAGACGDETEQDERDEKDCTEDQWARHGMIENRLSDEQRILRDRCDDCSGRCGDGGPTQEATHKQHQAQQHQGKHCRGSPLRLENWRNVDRF